VGRFIDRLREVRHRNDDPIKHVVVLMFENHSFDQMLGCFKAVYPDMEGVDPNTPRTNRDLSGRSYEQRPTNDTVVSPDPKHELQHILNQLVDGNSGFVSEYEREYPETTVEERQRIMDYFGMGDLPALHALAQEFTICDHWFSAVPGPTWTNRFFVHSGTSKGLVTMPTRLTERDYYAHYDQDTIFDRLNEKGVPWHVYFGDVPQSLVLRHQKRPRNVRNYRRLERFFSDAEAGNLPAYSFIEPHYFRGEQDDDHPPHATVPAQALLARVYNAIRSDEDAWNSTLLVVLYDEHGGFYDHIEPPSAVPPDRYDQEYGFDRLGVRVPALLISPWADAGVASTQFDHTSLLRYLIEKWDLTPLTARVSNANSIGDVLRTTGRPRRDTPASIPGPSLEHLATQAVATLAEPENDLQQSLTIFSKHLEQEELPVTAPAMEVMAMGAGEEEDRAKLRVEAFLGARSLEPDVS